MMEVDKGVEHIELLDDDKTVDKEEGKFIVKDEAEDEKIETNPAERETWTRSLDCILSLLGYAVGLGNLWRFPYLCMKNGGGAFLFPFLICLITLGLPLVFLEISLGQFVGRSSLRAWVVCPLFKGLGIGMILVTAVFSLYFNIIMAWSLYYLVNSFKSTLPWNTCDGWWNTDRCFIRTLSKTVNKTLPFNSSIDDMGNMTFNTKHSKISSEEEFWHNNVLQISPGLGDFGSFPWHIPVCFLCSWTMVFLCIMRGVKSIGKVVYVTALLPYILLTILLIVGLTQEGSVDGIIYYIKPNLQKMMSPQVWVEAALQVLLSLGPGFGPIITMASYNKFKNNCLRDALIICFVGEGTSVFSGLVVFVILGFISHELQLPIDDIVTSGPGLGFIAYPQAVSLLPMPQIWSALFFLMLIFLGLDCVFTCTESVIVSIMELFPHKFGKRRLLITMIVCVVGFLVGLPMCTQGGIYVFQLVDWYVALLAIPVFGLTECIIFAWIYGADRFSKDIRLMLDRDVPIVIRIGWCFVTPLFLVCCLVFSMMTYLPPTYGDYSYTVGGQAIGWIIAGFPIIPVVGVIVKQLIWDRSKGTSVMEKLSQLIVPSSEWRPHSTEHQQIYKLNTNSQDKDTTFLRMVKIKVLGH